MVSRILWLKRLIVAPLAGAWIEIPADVQVGEDGKVAPLAGAWIEMRQCLLAMIKWQKSHPSRVRGLKS